MNTFLLSIGSNENKTVNIDRCRQIISLLYPYTIFSESIESEPVGNGYEHDFVNQLALIESDDDEQSVADLLKEIEHEMGRLPQDKLAGIVVIDIDLLAVNNKIIKPEDFDRPYIKKLIEKFANPSINLLLP